MMIKPGRTTIMKYAAQLVEVNDNLIDFLLHQVNQAIPMDKLLEILEFAILVSWLHQMTHHGINPSQQMIAQFVQFCEHLESMEQILSRSSTKQLQDYKYKETQGPAGRNRKCGTR